MEPMPAHVRAIWNVVTRSRASTCRRYDQYAKSWNSVFSICSAVSPHFPVSCGVFVFFDLRTEATMRLARSILFPVLLSPISVHRSRSPLRVIVSTREFALWFVRPDSFALRWTRVRVVTSQRLPRRTFPSGHFGLAMCALRRKP